LGIRFLLQRYFPQLSPDIKSYSEALIHLQYFCLQIKALDSLPVNSSRLEEQEAQEEQENLDEILASELQRQ
jgi:hypothetical protein